MVARRGNPKLDARWILGVVSCCACGGQTIHAPPTNELASNPDTIVLVEGETQNFPVEDLPVVFYGMPADKITIACRATDKTWAPATTSGDWQSCSSATDTIRISVAAGASISSSAAICTDPGGCKDPENTLAYRPVVLAKKTAAADAGTARCSDEPRCAHAGLMARGVQLGARVEAQKLWNASGGDNGTPTQLPTNQAAAAVEGDFGYRFNDYFYLGAYMGVGMLPGTAGNRLTRAGAGFDLTLPVSIGRTLLVPNFGMYVGGAISPTGDSQYPNSTWGGPELSGHLGADFALSRSLLIGPYVALSHQWFETEFYSVQSFSPATDIQWCTFGAGLHAAYVFSLMPAGF